MPAQLEEVVVDADPRHAEHLREHPAQDLLRTVAGARAGPAPPAVSGAGSARRSSLPFTVSGSPSSTTTADGTMYSGSRPPRCARSSAASTPQAASAGTT